MTEKSPGERAVADAPNLVVATSYAAGVAFTVADHASAALDVGDLDRVRERLNYIHALHIELRSRADFLDLMHRDTPGRWRRLFGR